MLDVQLMQQCFLFLMKNTQYPKKYHIYIWAKTPLYNNNKKKCASEVLHRMKACANYYSIITATGLVKESSIEARL